MLKRIDAQRRDSKVSCQEGNGLGIKFLPLPPPSSSTSKAACRAVVVTALNANARAWWERLGFHPFEPDDPDRLDRCLLTSEIDATLKRAR